MSAYNDTIGILEKYKIKANKDLGQNFLINDDVIEKIIEKSQIKKKRFNNRDRARTWSSY